MVGGMAAGCNRGRAGVGGSDPTIWDMPGEEAKRRSLAKMSAHEPDPRNLARAVRNSCRDGPAFAPSLLPGPRKAPWRAWLPASRRSSVPASGPLRTFIPPPFNPGAFVLCAVEAPSAQSAALRVAALRYAALRVAAGGARGGRQLWRSALRADCPALLASRGRRKTRYAGCARCAQTAAASQFTKRAAHAPLEAALLGAPHGARPAHRLPLRDALWCSLRKPAVLVAKGCAGGGCGVIMKRRAAQA